MEHALLGQGSEPRAGGEETSLCPPWPLPPTAVDHQAAPHPTLCLSSPTPKRGPLISSFPEDPQPVRRSWAGGWGRKEGQESPSPYQGPNQLSHQTLARQRTVRKGLPQAGQLGQCPSDLRWGPQDPGTGGHRDASHRAELGLKPYSVFLFFNVIF